VLSRLVAPTTVSAPLTLSASPMFTAPPTDSVVFMVVAPDTVSVVSIVTAALQVIAPPKVEAPDTDSVPRIWRLPDIVPPTAAMFSSAVDALTVARGYVRECLLNGSLDTAQVVVALLHVIGNERQRGIQFPDSVK